MAIKVHIFTAHGRPRKIFLNLDNISGYSLNIRSFYFIFNSGAKSCELEFDGKAKEILDNNFKIQ